MKKSLLLPVFLMAAPLFSMDRLPEDQRDELKNRVGQIQFALEMGPYYFGDSRSMQRFIASQFEIIEKICDAHAIAHPRGRTMAWLEGFKKELSAKEAPQEEVSRESGASAESHTCDIAGLDKADVLKALFDLAVHGCFWPSASELTISDCQVALAQQRFNMDYVGGRPLKVDLRGNTFDTFLYDRENGAGAARRAIEGLRKKS